MSASPRKTYRPWEPPRYRQEAQRPDAKRPEGAVVCCWRDLVPQLDVRRCYAPDEEASRGAPPLDPALLVCLVLSASCGGVFSSRKMAQACERPVAFVAMGGPERPACRPIRDCRPLPLAAFCDGCGQGLRGAGAAGLVQRGHVATDGTTIPGHASRPKAMGDGYRHQEADRWRAAMAALVPQAHQQDAEDDAAVAAARQRLGTPRRGKAPTPVDETPDDKAQTHVTEPALPIMRTTNTGWEDGGTAPARVDAAHQSMGAGDVPAESHDKQPAEPMAPLTVASRAPAGILPPQATTGATQNMPATYDRGYDSAAAAAAVAPLGGDPSLATARQRHHAPEAASPDQFGTAKERRAAKGRTPAGRAVSARRQVIVEPVFGQSTEGRGCRRFLRRGLDHIRG